MITLGLVDSVDDNGVYVTMPGSRGVLRGPYKALSTVAAGTTVLVASTDDGEQVVVGAAPGQDGAVSVAAFGAKGDGATDDTAALQSAIDATPTGGVLSIPPGDYLITSALTISRPITVQGSGRHSSMILADDCGGFVIESANYVTLSALGVALAVRYTTTTNTHVGVDVEGSTSQRPSGHIYRDVYVDGFHTAWRVCYLWSSTFENVACDFGLVGLDIYGLSVNNVVTSSSLCVTISTSSRGIKFAGQESPSDSTDVATEGWVITDSLIYGGGLGVYLRAATHVTIESCIIDFCSTAGVRLEDNGTHFAGNSVIANNYIAMTGGAGVAAVHVNNAVSDSQNRGNRISGNHMITYSGSTCSNGVYIYDHPSASVITDNVLDEFGIDINMVGQGNQVIGNRCLSTPGASGNVYTTYANLIADNYGTVYLNGGEPRVYRADACGRKEWTALQAPTTGTHTIGDRVINAYPTVGQPIAWYCTVSGTPGTWVAGPNL